MKTKEIKSNKVERKKNILYFSLISVALFMLLRSFMLVYAVTSKTSIENQFDVFLQGFEDTTFTHMYNAYQSFGPLFNPKSSTEVVGGVTIASSMSNLSRFVLGWGRVLVIVHLLINIIKLAANNELIEQYWTKLIINSAIAIIAMEMVPLMLDVLYNIGDIFINAAIEAFQFGSLKLDVESNKDLLVEAFGDLPGFENLPEIINGSSGDPLEYSLIEKLEASLSLLKYIAWLPLIASIFLTFAAVFEIQVRALFTPIAIASIASGGARSGGVRYLGKYLGCFLKIAIYFVIALIGSLVMYHFFNEIIRAGGEQKVSVNLVLMILSPIVTAMAMMQTGGLGDEIIGL